MRLKTVFLVLGVLAIPSWYIYRTISDKRIPRLEWNEIFLTEDERLRKEMVAAQKKSEEEIKKAEEESSIGHRRAEAAKTIRECLDFANGLRRDVNAYREELARWNSDLEPLLHSRAGLAIAENEDYLRAFREIRQGVVPAELGGVPQDIEDLASGCEEARKNQPVDFSYSTSRLATTDNELNAQLQKLTESRSNLAALVLLANGQAPQTLEMSARKQRITETIEATRARRHYDLEMLRYGVGR